jgi:hypothetical protein
MTLLAEEAAKLVDSLPPEKAKALIEYARYLADKADEEGWERRFGDPSFQPKFTAMLREAERDISEGKTEPLDPRRL